MSRRSQNPPTGRALLRVSQTQLAQETPTTVKVAHVKAAQQTRSHTCHWPGCGAQVPPAMWGCKPHWFTLPHAIRSQIWRSYAPGQELTGTPSVAYATAARAAQDWIERHLEAMRTPPKY